MHIIFFWMKSTSEICFQWGKKKPCPSHIHNQSQCLTFGSIPRGFHFDHFCRLCSTITIILLFPLFRHTGQGWICSSIVCPHKAKKAKIKQVPVIFKNKSKYSYRQLTLHPSLYELYSQSSGESGGDHKILSVAEYPIYLTYPPIYAKF